MSRVLVSQQTGSFWIKRSSRREVFLRWPLLRLVRRTIVPSFRTSSLGSGILKTRHPASINSDGHLGQLKIFGHMLRYAKRKVTCETLVADESSGASDQYPVDSRRSTCWIRGLPHPFDTRLPWPTTPYVRIKTEARSTNLAREHDPTRGPLPRSPAMDAPPHTFFLLTCISASPEVPSELGACTLLLRTGRHMCPGLFLVSPCPKPHGRLRNFMQIDPWQNSK
jgi:hypothetical protein